MIDDSVNSIMVVAHDAGAANHILSWVEAGLIPIWKTKFYLAGPALTNSLSIVPSERLLASPDITSGIDLLITGSGWATRIEVDAIWNSRAESIKVITIIDHWVNYRERLSRDGRIVLPDEIWVTDQYAYAHAKNILPEVKCVLKPNVYLSSQLAFETSRNTDRTGSNGFLLFLMEPIRSSWPKKYPGEIEAFNYLLSRFATLNLDVNIPIVVRPHPSDEFGKYDVLKVLWPDMNIVINRSTSLIALIASSKLVAGCQTYAMVVALEYGRNVISALPPYAPACVLPHEGIIKLADMK